MQAKDLIVLGSSRLLGKLYCGDVDIGGSANISTISSALSLTDTTDSSSTTTGALKVSGGVGIAKKLYVGGNTYHSGATYFGSTYNINSSGQATLSQVKVGTGSGDTTITNNSATIANITSTEIKATNVNVTNKLYALKYDLESVADLGGSFIVAPTLIVPNSTQATDSNASLTVAKSGTTLTLTIKDPSISTNQIAGFTWTQNYKVKVSGKISNTAIGTCTGKITSTNLSSTQMTLSVICDSNIASQITAGSYQIANYNLNIMLYNADTSASGETLPIGIWLQSYGLTKNPTIEIWNGASTIPKVRLGYLNGIVYDKKDTTTNPNGLNQTLGSIWGLYSSDVYLEGSIVAKGGRIGGWTIGDGYITSNSNRTTYNATTAGITIDKDGIGAGNGSLNTFYLKHSDGSMMVKKGSIAGWRIESSYLASGTATAPAADTILLSPSGTSTSYTVGGKAQSGWVLTAGTTFGVDKTGGLYATSAHITGEITATALKIGSTDYLNDIQDISNKASSTALTTEINQRKAKYGTQSATSSDATSQAKAITCSDFELVAGNEITVYFKYANTYASGAVQLNVNSKGAKNIWVANAVTSTTNKLLWGKDAYITFRYNGSAFIVIGEPRIWYGACSTSASANAKTDTTAVTGCVICKGTVVNLAMTNENTGTAPTLNIQSTGALALYAGTGTTRPLASNGLSWSANTSQDFVFDGVQWRTADSGSAARSKALSDAAAKTATNCITEISNAGIWVTPSGKKPDSNGEPIVNETTGTTGTLINADGVSIYKTGKCVAQYADTVTIGQETSGSLRTKIDNDTFWITDGSTNIAYIGNNNGTITDTFVSDGEQTQFTLSSNVSSSNSSITISPSSVSVTRSGRTLTVTSGLPAAGNSFTCTYTPNNLIKYYSMGIRADTPIGQYSFVEGFNNTSAGLASHAEGYYTTASGTASHAEGQTTTASGSSSHAEGLGTIASGIYSHAEGCYSTVGDLVISGEANTKTYTSTTTTLESKAPLQLLVGLTITVDSMNFGKIISYTSDGNTLLTITLDKTINPYNDISNEIAYTGNRDVAAYGPQSHAEGRGTVANGGGCHSEGDKTYSGGIYSHSEGSSTVASGYFSHAEGQYTTASGASSHSEGHSTTASGFQSHAEGINTIASGSGSHAQNCYTISQSAFQTVIGKFNIAQGSNSTINIVNTDYAFIIGNGTSDDARSNALAVDWNGQVLCQGVSYIQGGYHEFFCGDMTSRAKAVNSSLNSNSSIAAWLNATIRAICTMYPGKVGGIFKGVLVPSSRAFFEICIYDTSNVNSSGIPQYAFGNYRQYHKNYLSIWWENYVYNVITIV